jgi:glycosyltransferase involved in cell wall biosynthesis
MRIAFYAPLKWPGHAAPSGDRQIARQLLQGLRLRGHETSVAARLRTFDREGDAARQRRIGAIGERMAARLAGHYGATGAAPDLWFTYHVHHKAPDVIGPAVAQALRIPYVIAEASIAPKQRHGRWSVGYAQARASIEAADGIVHLNPVDVDQVDRVRKTTSATLMLAPFVDARAIGALADTVRRAGHVEALRLITVAMMRQDAKLASYRLLAQALARLDDVGWTLTVVGDGPARRDVEQCFAGFGTERVRFLGERAPAEIVTLLARSDLFVWPAIDEALGLALIEAQAAGVPVVAGASGGVASVVAHEVSGLLVPPGDVARFADAVRRLGNDGALRRRMSDAAVTYVRERHDTAVAASALDRFLQSMVAR